MGQTLSDLFNRRQSGDYEDFVNLTQEEILPFLDNVRKFQNVILRLIKG
jgi:hypothetical protein